MNMNIRKIDISMGMDNIDMEFMDNMIGSMEIGIEGFRGG